MKPSEADVKNCFKEIIRARPTPALTYCVSYAKAGLSMSGEELRVQALYVLNNMTHWRGDTAKDIRVTLKRFTKP